MIEMDPRASGRLSRAGRRKLRVLVVDDHPEVRESLGDLLAAAGFEVICAEGGSSALGYLREHGGAEAVDVILLDYAMGDMTGDDFLAERARQPALGRTPVVFLTADGRAVAAAGASGHDCLGKPVEMDDLMAALERQVRRRP